MLPTNKSTISQLPRPSSKQNVNVNYKQENTTKNDVENVKWLDAPFHSLNADDDDNINNNNNNNKKNNNMNKDTSQKNNQNYYANNNINNNIGNMDFIQSPITNTSFNNVNNNIYSYGNTFENEPPLLEE